MLRIRRARPVDRACGFEVVGRSPVDDGGRSFPLLHLRDTWVE